MTSDLCTCNPPHKNELGEWHSLSCPSTCANRERELALAALGISSAINGGVEDAIRDTVGDEALKRFQTAVANASHLTQGERKP